MNTLGDLIALTYAAMLAEFGDREIASIATAAIVNDYLLSMTVVEESDYA